MDVTAIEFLLANSEDWLQYAVRRNLLNEKEDGLVLLKDKALKDNKIKQYLRDISNFHGTIVSTHKNPDLSVNKLLFLLDIGLDRTIPEIDHAIEAILEHRCSDGVYQSAVNIPKHFGGSGEDTFGWCLCDAPLLLLALMKAGVDYKKFLRPGVDHLVSSFQKNGFPCVVSRELGRFRGPGRKEDPCPYATLVMLRLFAESDQYRNSDIAASAIQGILDLWEKSFHKHPYMFYMGNDFRKLKAPAIWYDIVSVADTLSRFDVVKKDARFIEMISIIEAKRDENGLYTPESVYLKCNDWDFGQKKKPSPYLTYLCMRISERAGV
jgi:hypothetical protein